MAILDIFSTPFLFSVAITVILIVAIVTYVSYKMSEQDHKLTSMVNLVSILAQDLQFIKSKIHTMQNTNDLQYSPDLTNVQNQTELISVSDDDNEEYIDDTENDDSENDDSENDDSENDDSVIDDSVIDDSENDNIEEPQEHIKFLNLSLANEDVKNDSPIEVLEIDGNNDIDNENIKTIHIETSINVDETEIPEPLEDNLFDLKNTDLGDIDNLHSSKTDYKKMSLNKLREAVVNKGIVVDASKFKKNELLKMLGDE